MASWFDLEVVSEHVDPPIEPGDKGASWFAIEVTSAHVEPPAVDPPVAEPYPTELDYLPADGREGPRLNEDRYLGEFLVTVANEDRFTAYFNVTNKAVLSASFSLVLNNEDREESSLLLSDRMMKIRREDEELLLLI